MPASSATDPTTLTPTETVEAFLDALTRMDVEAARGLLAPDVVYTNVPYPPARGIAATEKVLLQFLKLADGFEVETISIAANGGTVLTERIDAFTRGRFRTEFWVCGTFEVRDGRITVWRDRFDHADIVGRLVRNLARLPGRLRRG